MQSRPTSYELRLNVIEGPHAGKEFVFEHYDIFVAGRSQVAHLRLDEDRHLSRFHLRLEINPPTGRLIDLQSRNGTFLNGERVQDALLKDGDEIRAGRTILRVSVSSPPSTDDWTPYSPTVIETPSMFPSIPEYQVTRELGRGGMGIVYHAQQRSTGKDVALKLIQPDRQPEAEALQLFVREASVLSQLRHKNIVESIEFGLHQKLMYLAMEYIDVVDIVELLNQRTKVKRIQIACGVMAYVLQALQYSHQQDIVHRDVKPSNILVYRKGQKLTAKLSDFGLAKNFVNAGFSDITSDYKIKGTLAYIAPEQLLNSRYAKPACDIYSAGACLYQFLTMHSPHENGAKHEVATILNKQPVPILKRVPDLPKGLADVVHRALAWEPQDRYATAEQMRKALLPFILSER